MSYLQFVFLKVHILKSEGAFSENLLWIRRNDPNEFVHLPEITDEHE